MFGIEGVPIHGTSLVYRGFTVFKVMFMFRLLLNLKTRGTLKLSLLMADL